MTTPQSARPERRSALTIGLIATVIVGILALGGGLTLGVRALIDAIPTPADVAAVLAPEPYQEVGPVVIASIQELAELTTVEMVEYTIVEKGTDEGWLEWARGDSVRLMAVANIGAGVDLSGLTESDFEFGDDGAVQVTLPHATVHYVAVDNAATQVLERDTGLFTKGDVDLETESRRLAETVLVEQALDNGILTEAESNAEKAVASVLGSLGYEDVTVSFTA